MLKTNRGNCRRKIVLCSVLGVRYVLTVVKLFKNNIRVKKMKKNFILMMAVVFAAFGAQSCLKSDNDYKKQQKVDDKILAEFVATSAATVTRHSEGFYYMNIPSMTLDAIPNSGKELKKDDVVSFNYKISLLNGNVIETNVGDVSEGSQPAMIKLMTYTVIPEAIDYGIRLMKVGETFRFFIPSYLAYGSFSTKDFGPHSNFIVDIEVTGVQSESELDDIQRDSIANYVAANYSNLEFKEYASGLYMIDSIAGEGDRPFSNSIVILDFARKYLDETLIHSVNGAEVFLDRGMAVQGLEEGIKLTREGGTSILIMPASIGFKQSVCVIPEKARDPLFRSQIINNNVRPYSILKYVLKLKVVNL